MEQSLTGIVYSIAYNDPSREVEFFDITDSKSVLDEVEGDLTPKQSAQLRKQLERFEKHGFALDADYFKRVQKAKKVKLHELRLTLDRVEYRILFADEDGFFVMLCGYKETRNDVPDGKVQSAESRLVIWRDRRTPKVSQKPGKR